MWWGGSPRAAGEVPKCVPVCYVLSLTERLMQLCFNVTMECGSGVWLTSSMSVYSCYVAFILVDRCTSSFISEEDMPPSARNARRQARRPISSQRARPYDAASGDGEPAEDAGEPVVDAGEGAVDAGGSSCARVGACAASDTLEPHIVFHLPAFWQGCNGSPADWNTGEQCVVSRYTWKKTLQDARALKPKTVIRLTQGELAQQFLKTFLSTRPGLQGECLMCKLGAPEILDEIWTKFPIRQPASTAMVPDNSWRIGFHGSRMECLYSILSLGKLQGSQCVDAGDRFFDGRPGVYMHAADRSHKIEPYLTWLWIEGWVPGGVFAKAIAVQFETLYDPQGSNRLKKRTDQVIMREESVLLTNLMLGMTDNLSPGQYTQSGWSPHAEANPLQRLSRDASG